MMATLLAMLVALAVDRFWGEPPVRWHPVVWMGNYLQKAGAWLQRHTQQDPAQKDFKAFWLAALVWLAGAAMVSGVACGLEWLLLQSPWALPWWAAGVGLGLLLKPLLAWAMLQSEVRAVEAALAESLPAGRERLRWLVSRDVAQLSETQVRESAIETLAENLNDSVIAPLFWFVLLGLPGAALFRFANTADGMWGYRGLYQGRNWEWAGKWAAWTDDVLGWIPARLTALLLAVVAGGVSWARLRTEARLTASPNSGWPMAAMALGLGVCLHKPGVYALNGGARAPANADTTRAINFAQNSLLALVATALAAIVLIVICSALGVTQ